MDMLFTLIPFSVLVITLVAFIVLLASAIVFNFHAGMKYRTALADRLHSLRLGRMLAALGIDIETYLSSERVVDIHQHMQRCSECTNIGPCDEGLADGTISPENIDFCNNEQSLQKIVQRKATGNAPDVY
jgi:Family of unknown function (DUF6455)